MTLEEELNLVGYANALCNVTKERDEALDALQALIASMPNGEIGNRTWGIVANCEALLKKHGRLPAAGGAE